MQNSRPCSILQLVLLSAIIFVTQQEVAGQTPSETPFPEQTTTGEPEEPISTHYPEQTTTSEPGEVVEPEPSPQSNE